MPRSLVLRFPMVSLGIALIAAPCGARAAGAVSPLDMSVPIDNSGSRSNTGAVTGALVNEATGLLTNAPSGTWTGDVLSNQGRLDNQGRWNGEIDTSGSFSNEGSVSGSVTNAGDFVNNGAGAVGGRLVNSGTATNNGVVSAGVVNTGAFVNNASGSASFIDNEGGTSSNAGLVGALDVSAGKVVNTGTDSGGASVSAWAELENSGTIAGGAASAGVLVNNASGVIDGGIEGLGTLTNNGAVQGGVGAASVVNNASGVISGDLSLSGRGSENSGTIKGDVTVGTATSSAASFVNDAGGFIKGSLSNFGFAVNDGEIDGAVANSGQFVNNSAGIVGGGLAMSGGSATNNGCLEGGARVTAGALTNNGALSGAVDVSGGGAFVNNSRLAGSVTNAATVVNNAAGVITGDFANAGEASNSGLIGGAVANSAKFTNTATGRVEGGFIETGGTALNAGEIRGGLTARGGTIVSTGSIAGPVDIGASASLLASGIITGAVRNSGLLAVSDGTAWFGRTLTLGPGSSLSGVVTIPVDLTTGQSNFLAAKGAATSAATIRLEPSLTDSTRPYWRTLAYSDKPIALDPASKAELAALSNPLYAYAASADGRGVTQTINPGLAGVAPNHAMATLTALQTGLYLDPSTLALMSPDAESGAIGASLWERGGAASLHIGNASTIGASPAFNAANFSTDYRGDQFGLDAGTRLGGFELHAGVTGAFAKSSTVDADVANVSGATVALSGGSYALLSRGGAFVSFASRYQRYDMVLEDAPLAVSHQSVTAQGMTYATEAGLDLIADGRFLFRPSAALYLTRLGVGGQAANVGYLSYDAIDSELGRAGFRLGTSLQDGALRFEPYLTAQLWREWRGTTTTHIADGPTLSTAGPSVFARLGLGFEARLPPGFAAFAEAAWTGGADMRGWSASGGLRRDF